MQYHQSARHMPKKAYAVAKNKQNQHATARLWHAIAFALALAALLLIASQGQAAPSTMTKIIDGKVVTPPKTTHPNNPVTANDNRDDRSKKSGVYTFISGTGFFISNNKLVTNAHVVRNCQSIRVRGSVKPTYATIEALDVKNDLALLKTKHRSKSIATIRSHPDAAIGEAVTVVGYPQKHGLKGTYVVRKASILDNDDPFFDKNKMLFTDTVEKGNSGGPLLDKHGSVVGVVVGKVSYFMTDASTAAPKANAEPFKTSSVAINLPTLKGFLQKNGAFFRSEQAQNRPGYTSPESRAKNFVANVHCIQD